MQFSAVTLLALAGSAAAMYNATATNGTVYVTEVVTALTTVCPAATELTYNGHTYTATESTTLTITNCPCTIIKPITTSTSVICNTCAPVASSVPAGPVYGNSTMPAGATNPAATTKTAVGTTSAASSSTAVPSNFSSSGANKIAMSGSLAGLFGLAAYFL